MDQASGSFMLSGGVFKFGTGWGNNLKEVFIGFLHDASRRSLPSNPAERAFLLQRVTMKATQGDSSITYLTDTVSDVDHTSVALV